MLVQTLKSWVNVLSFTFITNTSDISKLKKKLFRFLVNTVVSFQLSTVLILLFFPLSLYLFHNTPQYLICQNKPFGAVSLNIHKNLEPLLKTT